MAFGQPSGPPATGKQLQELMQLLNAAGHTDFRDARGPMGFTQRQAGGKFTRDEADAFIAQLQEWAEIAEAADAPVIGGKNPKIASAVPPAPPIASPAQMMMAPMTTRNTRPRGVLMNDRNFIGVSF